MIRKLVSVSAFLVASLAMTTSASANPGACWAQFDQAMAACNGNEACEQQANIDLGVCLESLSPWLDPGG